MNSEHGARDGRGCHIFKLDLCEPSVVVYASARSKSAHGKEAKLTFDVFLMRLNPV